ncbi:MAG: TrkA family potassium uptake protein [Salinirussus sp.]
MKYVIVGFGRVGTRTARILDSEGYEVTVVEQDATTAERAREAGFDVVEGDGGDESVLESTGLSDAAAVAGLTGNLKVNFSACLVGKRHGCRTVLRVDEEVSDELYNKYDEEVDEIIYPERFGAAGAKTALLGGNFNVIADLTEHLSVATVTIPGDAPVVGRRVVDVELPGEARIYAHGRHDEDMRIPLPQTAFEAGDSVAVMARPDDLGEVREALRGAG